MAKLAEKDKCTGCKACGDACPVQAITFREDEKEFWYPEISASACVSCGMCEKVCPVIGDKQGTLRKSEPQVYKAYSKSTEVREKSTSGGAFFELASAVIRNGGIVYGSRYTDDLQGTFHTFAKTEKELEPLVGSKYFQSDTERVYREIEQNLREEKTVLFSGAPCQSAAVQCYMNAKNVNTEKLYLMDFICLGINAPLAYQSFLKSLETRYKSKAVKVRFKDKSNGWLQLGTKIDFKSGKTYYGNSITDPWVNSYIVGKFAIRESCSNCMFKGLPRVSDISVGDFWGIKYTEEEAKLGVSLVMVNTQKGAKLWDAVKEQMYIADGDLSVARAGNPQIDNRVKINLPLQKKFFQMLQSTDYESAVWNCLSTNRAMVQIRNCKNGMIKYIKRIVNGRK